MVSQVMQGGARLETSISTLESQMKAKRTWRQPRWNGRTFGDTNKAASDITV